MRVVGEHNDRRESAYLKTLQQPKRCEVADQNRR